MFPREIQPFFKKKKLKKRQLLISVTAFLFLLQTVAHQSLSKISSSFWASIRYHGIPDTSPELPVRAQPQLSCKK